MSTSSSVSSPCARGVADTSGITLLLVLPPQRGLLEGFSSGLISLANYVEQAEPSVDVRLLDFGPTPADRLPAAVARAVRVAGRRRLFIGITTTTASYQSALRTAELFKREAPSGVVVMGGHHASAQDEQVLSHRTVDVVVRGEGEVALVELLRRHPNLNSVPGISYRDSLTVRRTAAGPLLDQAALDRLGPSFDDLGVRSAPGKFEHITYVSARGCPLSCAFCSVANERIRAKSVDAVVADLRHLVRKMGYSSIAIEDNFFAHSAARTVALCTALQELAHEVSFSWDCQTRVESMRSKRVIDVMERAGCEAVYLGVESLVPRHLLYLGKTKDPEKYLEQLECTVVPQLMRSSIACYINLQLALPGETPRDRKETLKAVTRLGRIAAERGKTLTVFPQLHVVYPGTRHYNDAVATRRFGPSTIEVFESFTRWEAEHEPILRWLGEHFAHGVGGIPEGLLAEQALREGKFEVDDNVVLETATQLSELEDCPGTSVFRYGRYLAHDDDVADYQDLEAINGD